MYPVAHSGLVYSSQRRISRILHGAQWLWFAILLGGFAASANAAAPTVTISNPGNGATFTQPVDVVIDATASDSDGTVIRVEFLANGSKVGEDASDPYSFTWTNTPAGLYALTAVAIDNSNARATSAPVNITVNAPTTPTTNTFVALGSTWKYLDDGSDQGIDWILDDFDDTSWVSGPAQLGYGDGDEVTTVSYGPDPNNKYVTTYFRRFFVVDSPEFVQTLTVNVLRDDGAV